MGIIYIIGISLFVSFMIVIVIDLLLLFIPDIIDSYEKTVERLEEHKEWKKVKDKKEIDLDILEDEE